MATQALKNFRIKHVIRSTAPPRPLVSVLPQSQTPPESSTPSLPLVKRTNPFVPQLNAKTGRWAPPKCSLRQQADLIKKARAVGVLDLLPPSPKTNKARETITTVTAAQPIANGHGSGSGPKTRPIHLKDAWWQKSVQWIGKVKERKVDGADIGNKLYGSRKRMFKGHKWERVAEKRAIRRKMLLRDMPKRIFRYKQHYKRRRPNPLKSADGAKSGKLPF